MLSDVFGRNKSGSMENSTGGDLVLNNLISQMNQPRMLLRLLILHPIPCQNRKNIKGTLEGNGGNHS